MAGYEWRLVAPDTNTSVAIYQSGHETAKLFGGVHALHGELASRDAELNSKWGTVCTPLVVIESVAAEKGL